MGDTITCTLSTEARRCTRKDCHRCGWNKAVKDAREEQLREEGLTEGSDGLHRLALAVDTTVEVVT